MDVVSIILYFEGYVMFAVIKFLFYPKNGDSYYNRLGLLAKGKNVY